MTEQQIIKLIQSLPESDRNVYLNPTETCIVEDREIELKEDVFLEFMVIAYCDYVRQIAITDETGRHQYEYVSLNETIDIYPAEIYIDGVFAFELTEDITKYFTLIV